MPNLAYHPAMNASKILLLPGQGAQVVGMGKAWCDASSEARAVFAEADSILAGQLPVLADAGDAGGGHAATLSELCFNGPAEILNRTDVSQPAIFTAGVACWRGLLAKWGVGQNAGVHEAGVIAAAGLSLGEYTALHIAGAFSFADGLRLVALRGRAMQDAAEASFGGMVALIGADEAQAQQVCDETLAAGRAGNAESGAANDEVLVCANFNAPGQIVISGSKSACDRAAAADGPAAKLGLRATALTVAGAFHSPLMAPAAARLREALEKTEIRPPRCTVIANVTAKPHGADADGIRRMLVEQLTSPVRWAQSAALLAQQHGAAGAGGTGAEFHELAPGKTLAGLMRRIDKATKVISHDEPSGP